VERAFISGFDRGEFKTDLLVVILSRAFMFAVLFGVGLSFGSESSSLSVFWVYGGFIVLFLGLFAFTPRHTVANPVGILLFFQFLVEILAEATLVIMAGGYTSDYGLLFLLTIVSAAYFFRIAGALILAAAASLVFGTIGFAHLGHPLLVNWIQLEQLTLQSVQVRYFLYTTLFFLIAFITSQWTRRLDRIRSRLEGAEEALDLARFSAEGMMQDLPSGILFFDGAGRLRFWNKLANSLLGGHLQDGEALLTLLGGVLPPPYLGQIIAARESQIPEGCDAIGPLGQPLRIWLKPLVRDGQYLGCLFTLLDLTEEKRFEAALQRRQRMSALGEMSARIAHEIRNPLAAIFGASQMLEGTENLGDSDKRLMALITSESRRLNQFLKDLLEFVKDRPANWRPVMASEILEKTCDVLKNSEGVGKLTRIEAELPGGDFQMVTDRDLLLQVLLNLGLNALEAMREQEENGILALSIQSVEGKVELLIRDNGPGMDTETLAKVYDPFFTTKESGTGLGLAVCHHTVQTLGGNIMLQSALGSGTLVHITLPIEPTLEEENRG
jgi:two-component system sensor histidine kinase PilS (NtrC family)